MEIATKPIPSTTIMQPVRSGTMRRVGYDDMTETLVIDFTAGTYMYDGVPERIHRGLMNAESKGRYFSAFIKGKFGTTKIPYAPAARAELAATS